MNNKYLNKTSKLCELNEELDKIDNSLNKKAKKNKAVIKELQDIMSNTIENYAKIVKNLDTTLKN